MGRRYHQRVVLTDDQSELESGSPSSPDELLAEHREHLAAWSAWNSLPEESRTLLWHLIIEEETPAQLAPLLGTSPNAVASRAKRARERLRQAFLNQHLGDTTDEACLRVRPLFGAYVRLALSARDRKRVDDHLRTCARCRAALEEITDTDRTLRGVVAPLLLGSPQIAERYLRAVDAEGAGVSPARSAVRSFRLSRQGIAVAFGVAAVVALGVSVSADSGVDYPQALRPSEPSPSGQVDPSSIGTLTPTTTSKVPPGADPTMSPSSASTRRTAPLAFQPVGPTGGSSAPSPLSSTKPSEQADRRMTFSAPSSAPSTTTAATTLPVQQRQTFEFVPDPEQIYLGHLTVSGGWTIVTIRDVHDGNPYEHLTEPVTEFDHYLRPGALTVVLVRTGGHGDGQLTVLFTGSSGEELPGSGTYALS